MYYKKKNNKTKKLEEGRNSTKLSKTIGSQDYDRKHLLSSFLAP